jgi:hypothetical protein
MRTATATAAAATIPAVMSMPAAGHPFERAVARLAEVRHGAHGSAIVLRD